WSGATNSVTRHTGSSRTCYP
ncbi:MAG: hypothetical protein AVDCRST_MAG68-1819, partial [uncultured Gemmatimonadetes bacterium]